MRLKLNRQIKELDARYTKVEWPKDRHEHHGFETYAMRLREVITENVPAFTGHLEFTEGKFWAHFKIRMAPKGVHGDFTFELKVDPKWPIKEQVEKLVERVEEVDAVAVAQRRGSEAKDTFKEIVKQQIADLRNERDELKAKLDEIDRKSSHCAECGTSIFDDEPAISIGDDTYCDVCGSARSEELRRSEG